MISVGLPLGGFSAVLSATTAMAAARRLLLLCIIAAPLLLRPLLQTTTRRRTTTTVGRRSPSSHPARGAGGPHLAYLRRRVCACVVCPPRWSLFLSRSALALSSYVTRSSSVFSCALYLLYYVCVPPPGPWGEEKRCWR